MRVKETMHKQMVNQGTQAPFTRLHLGSHLLGPCRNASPPWPDSDLTCNCFLFKCWH